MRRIYQLAADATRLRHTDHTADQGAIPRKQSIEQLAVIARNRDLTEIAGRANSVPPSWADLARRLGHIGRAWTD
ncbi:hypothetical protein ACQPXH_20455 [Nocardia sp. CA-135953]|uniref:hypothetical protein n=1 Tax=Nocardia sp. CA-135953 TaxID=3239978 RepID=UPI003D997BDE